MDVSETMLQAVDILIKKRIESVRFDETIDATIIDASKSESGQYLVSTGSAKFWAYSQETKYRQNERVLVTIPQGNYDNQKIIIGKKADNIDGPLPYRSAFSQIIDLTNNLIIGDQGEKGIWANKNDEYQWDITDKDFIPDNISYVWKLPITSTPLQGYTRLGIRAQFSTYLGQYNVIAGNYGLALRLIFGYADGQEGSFDKFVYFDSASFYGNPYNYLTYYTLEDVFDISEYKDYPINGMELYIYQRGNFKEVNGTNVPAPDDGQIHPVVVQNIWMKDPYVCLGTGTEEFLQDTTTIYTSNSMTYRGLTTSNIADENFDSSGINNTKIIQLRWVHKDPETEVIKTLSMDDEIDTNEYEIRWYKYRVGAEGDGYAGAHWEQIVYNINQLQIFFTPDVTLSQEQVKVLILRNDSLLVASNILTFKNDNEVANRATLIDANALAIKCTDSFQGHYYLYNAANEIVNQKLAEEQRTLQAVFGVQPNVNDKPDLIVNNFSSIIWMIPSTNTMINLISAHGNPVDGYYTVSGVNQIQFSIKKTLAPGYQNNTILLKTISNQGETYPTAQITLLFGTKGDNGSDYTIDFRWDNDKNALDVSEANDSLIGHVALRGYDGEIINWPNGSQLQVSWHVATKPGAANQATVVKQSAEIGTYYPVASAITPITFLAPNPNDQPSGWHEVHPDNQPSGWYYVGGDDGTKNYTYDDSTKSWSFTSGSMYRPLTANDTKYQLSFKPIIEFENIDLVTQTVDINAKIPDDSRQWHADSWTEGEPPNTVNYGPDPTIYIINDSKYYYFKKNTYFVMLDNQYVIDPFDNYVDGVTYYEPYEATSLVWNQVLTNIPSIIGPNSNNPTTFTIRNNNTSINTILILELRVTKFGDYDLVKYVPVPLKKGTTDTYKISGISGPTQVVYNSNGTIEYYRNPFEIRTASYSNNQWSNQDHGISSTGLSGYWQLIYPIITGDKDNFRPSLIETRPDVQQPNNGQYDLPVLNPVGVYIPEAVPYAVQFVRSEDPVVLWTQPIVCYENRYQSGTLNAWNGKEIVTDNDSSTIVASGFAAGRKEVDNTFSGVMLGDWSRTHQEHAVIAKNTGIYGFNHGAMSYAFKDDGTGFIGKDGKGRIYFDGNSSTIYSSNWLGNPQQGMLLDIDDGYLKMQSSHEKYEPYFVTSQNIRDTCFEYNQNSLSWEYNPEKGDGYIKLYNISGNELGIHSSYDPFGIYYSKSDNAETNYITLGVNQTRFPLSIGTSENVTQRNFRVAWDGTTYITNGNISGAINATILSSNYGNIGGWEISSNGLTNNYGTILNSQGITTKGIIINDNNNNALGTIGYTTSNIDYTSGIGIQQSENNKESVLKITSTNAGIKIVNNNYTSSDCEAYVSCQDVADLSKTVVYIGKHVVFSDFNNISCGNQTLADYIRSIAGSSGGDSGGGTPEPSNDYIAIQQGDAIPANAIDIGWINNNGTWQYLGSTTSYSEIRDNPNGYYWIFAYPS